MKTYDELPTEINKPSWWKSWRLWFAVLLGGTILVASITRQMRRSARRRLLVESSRQEGEDFAYFDCHCTNKPEKLTIRPTGIISCPTGPFTQAWLDANVNGQSFVVDRWGQSDHQYAWGGAVQISDVYEIFVRLWCAKGKWRVYLGVRDGQTGTCNILYSNHGIPNFTCATGSNESTNDMRKDNCRVFPRAYGGSMTIVPTPQDEQPDHENLR